VRQIRELRLSSLSMTILNHSYLNKINRPDDIKYGADSQTCSRKLYKSRIEEIDKIKQRIDNTRRPSPRGLTEDKDVYDLCPTVFWKIGGSGSKVQILLIPKLS